MNIIASMMTARAMEKARMTKVPRWDEGPMATVSHPVGNDDKSKSSSGVGSERVVSAALALYATSAAGEG